MTFSKSSSAAASACKLTTGSAMLKGADANSPAISALIIFNPAIITASTVMLIQMADEELRGEASLGIPLKDSLLSEILPGKFTDEEQNQGQNNADHNAAG